MSIEPDPWSSSSLIRDSHNTLLLNMPVSPGEYADPRPPI